ncbi:MAG: hypothetical protein H7Y17_04135 [Chlorobia bacterium]|nr:hypothetical protein [Fimbriimonadaceae bacterium]
MAAAAVALGFGFSSMASAQSLDFKIPVKMSYGAATPSGTWNTVLIVSAAVMAVGLITGETTLTILGGAGVLVSLTQTNKSGFRPQYFARGLDLVQSGPVSFGVRPFGPAGLHQGITTLQPSPYIVANFKF